MILEAEAFAEIVLQNEAAIEEKLFKAVQESMYSNKMRVAPRRLRQIAHEEITALRNFLAHPETAQVQERGRQLAEEGFGHRAMVNLTTTLRLAGWEWCVQQANVLETITTIEAYTSALMEGYMTGFEALLQREQQLTHEAYQRARNQ